MRIIDDFDGITVKKEGNSIFVKQGGTNISFPIELVPVIINELSRSYAQFEYDRLKGTSK